MERVLSQAEYQFAFTEVFQATLPLNKHIWVDDSLGWGDRPWTNWIDGTAYLHLGPIAKEDLTKGDDKHDWADFGFYCDVFIHEMTHVWQYYHGRHVKTNAVLNQLEGWADNVAIKVAQRYGVAPSHVRDLSDIYAYEPGGSWSSYNVEQQAQIVEDWFSSDTRKVKPGFASTKDLRWPYIQIVRLAGETWDEDLLDDEDRDQDFIRRSKIEHYGHNA